MSTSDRSAGGELADGTGGSHELIAAALERVADLPARSYERQHEVDKRVLDVVRLEQSAAAFGLSSIEISPEIRLFHDSARALLFFKNMSSTLLYLDRAVTNRKPLTKRILANAGIPVARGSEASTPEQVRQAFAALDGAAVIKPVTGSGGRDVSTHISTAEQAAGAAAPILASGRNVLVEEMVTGLDLRVTVIDGRTVGATLRVPANVVGDGRSTIAMLVEEKNALRSTSDYVRHQLIELGADKERYLGAQKMTEETVPNAGQRVFLHYVANISAGGDSYEVLDRVHPQVADLAVRAAALFPTSLHAGVDLLLERFDAPVSTQRAIVCEVNLNNELPMHLYPVYGTSSPVDDLVIAAHWATEARLPFSTWSKDTGLGKVALDMRQLAGLITEAESAGSAHQSRGTGQGEPVPHSPRELDHQLLQAALTDAAPPGTTALLADDPRFVHLRTATSESIAERSGRTLIAGAIGADEALMHRVARTCGIPVMARHWLRASQKEKAAELVDRRWRTWLLRLPRPDSTMHKVRVASIAELDAAWEQVPASGRFRLVEIPTEAACVLLMDGTRLLATQLRAPLQVTGDGTRTLSELVEAEIAARRANPVLAGRAAELRVEDLLSEREAQADTVLGTGQTVRLGRSPRLADGAATVGLGVSPWPELEVHAARFMTAIGNPGLATLAFVPRQRAQTEATWALWRFHSDPSPAQFHLPLAGPGYDAYPAVARRILSGPSRAL